ncbi:isopenicillin-N epimerase [Chitinophaga sp. CF118]|uniref:aminotransferase class V-fold PLP-dependent enzyme n=1 Tax=Chitinophaga sp. CF118 TaxID=1884367 RepID=UPI0008ECE3C5|nr:aminotransferase class V-fold PLP-dependent enzyme [Chitinophaga sp. CF118]SFD01258.1 isopenicillin-N epimerase [Chitinophaga sp. CF118]
MTAAHYSDKAHLWSLDPKNTFLNHGSYGAAPVAVLEEQSRLRKRMEAEPVSFMKRELEPLWDNAREEIAKFIGTTASNLVFVKNATMGVNTIFHSLDFNPGDEVLTTSHVYGACMEVLKYYEGKKGFTIKVATVPFPLKDEDEVVDALKNEITDRTKLLLIDHITSVTGTIFPLEKILLLFKQRGIEVLVDGAHAIGMLDLDIDKLGADYYVGNCHKWVCSPKGSAILYVHPSRQEKISPLQISYHYDLSDEWAKKFFWSGTDDPTAYLCVPTALQQMNDLYGSWELLRKHNRDLTLTAKQYLEKELGTTPPIPDNMIGSLANIYLGKGVLSAKGFNYIHPLPEVLFSAYGIVVPVMIFPKHDPQLWIRISVQAYNHISQYEYLAAALKELGYFI